MRTFIVISLLGISFPLTGMQKAKALLEENPKISAFVAGAVTATCLIKMLSQGHANQIPTSAPVNQRQSRPQFVHHYLYETKSINALAKQQEESHTLMCFDVNSIVYKHCLPGKVAVVSSAISGQNFTINFTKKKSLQSDHFPQVTLDCTNRELTILVQSQNSEQQAIDCCIDMPFNEFGHMNITLFDNQRILYQKRSVSC